MERDSELRNGTPAATVGRVTAVLDAFLRSTGDLGVTELAGQLGLAKSVVHRLLTALADAEYLSHNPGSRRYALGPKAVRLGLAALGQMNIRERALPYLRALAAATGETATLSLLVGEHRVYAEQVESSHPVRQLVQIGAGAPLHLGASGKAILAFLPPARIAAILHTAARAHPTRVDGTRLDLRALEQSLEQIRRCGYATSQSERVLGAASAAAPVFDHRGSVIASISVASVTIRHTSADLARFGEQARECAARLSAELGWAGPLGAPAAAGPG